MPIIDKIDENGKKCYSYQSPPKDIIFDERQALIKEISKYLSKQNDIELVDVDVDLALISEILIRVDKRKEYFTIFHNKMKMNELKKTALIMFWIIKFKPCSVKTVDQKLKRKYEQINEAFAIFLLLSATKRELKMDANAKLNISKGYLEKLLYAFRYWDLSKEALMMIAETICELVKYYV